VYLLGVSSCSGSTSEPGQPVSLPLKLFFLWGLWETVDSGCYGCYPQ
jgi:hypothetical protein